MKKNNIPEEKNIQGEKTVGLFGLNYLQSAFALIDDAFLQLKSSHQKIDLSNRSTEFTNGYFFGLGEK